ncbi:MAG: hypothetical protein DRG78_06540 [Epsilonproteobacteria bacterium]|nr:MAG: hypothetical protein DRG78_06540 [Campylobacterota bacterium]
MLDINTYTQNNFNNNILYLQKHHYNLYQKILEYENQILNNNLPEEFALDYINSCFDIVELSTERYLYAKQSSKLIEIMKKSVNFKKNENVFETFKILDKSSLRPAYNFAFELFEKYGDKTKELKHIYKFIFFGSGLHLEQIHKKVAAKSYLIVEDNIELFRLSLFTTKYFELAKEAQLFFAVDCDNNKFDTIAKIFLEKNFYYNQYIKFFESISHSENKLKQFHTLVVSQSHLNFFYTSILEQYTRPLNYLQNNYKFINLNSNSLKMFCKKQSAILVAPGPSLDKNIELINNSKEKLFIVALSATLSTLENANIQPDIVTHFDGFERSKTHFDKLQNKNFLQNSILLFSAKTPQSIVNMFTKEQIFFFESGTNYKEGFGELSAFCAGSATYLILMALKFKNIYLIGLDLALDEKTLKTHCASYSYSQKINENENENVLTFRDSIIEVEGNLQNIVKSTPNFKLSIDAINEITAGLKEEYQKIYNISNGARFCNIEPANSIELKSKKKNKSLKESKKYFQLNCKDKLSSKEQLFLSQIFELIQTKKTFIVNFSTFKHTDIASFEKSLIQLENDLCYCRERVCEVFSILFSNYLRYVYGFIFDSCNTKDITIDLNTIQLQLTQSLLDIIEKLEIHFKAR